MTCNLKYGVGLSPLDYRYCEVPVSRRVFGRGKTWNMGEGSRTFTNYVITHASACLFRLAIHPSSYFLGLECTSLNSLFPIFISNQKPTIIAKHVYQHGGINIAKTKEASDLNHQTSVYECSHLKCFLKVKDELDSTCHDQVICKVRAESRNIKRVKAGSTLRHAHSSMVKV